VVRTGLGVPDAIARLRADPDIEYAEPNWVYTVDAVSNDTYVVDGRLWGMVGANGSQASAAWANNHTNCSNVYVGIIDEGYYFDHPDLKDNAAVVTAEANGVAGRDDDGNGYVDDVRGWDFANGDNTVFDGSTDDHGTHVAGTIGGTGGNGAGVAGVCWSVKMLNAKFLGRNGGTTTNAIKAVDYFTDLKGRGYNVVATSNSWGGGGFSSALESAIGRADAAGILFIAAAGNSTYNCETSSCYPAEYDRPNVIAVASITSDGVLSSFSNYGSTSVDIAAPGSGIISTVPVSSKGSVVPGYASYSGTSMATPHVSGAAALYAAYKGGSAATIKAAILNSATRDAKLTGKVATGGRLNVSGF
jgi:subtilisin family serine protease